MAKKTIQADLDVIGNIQKNGVNIEQAVSSQIIDQTYDSASTKAQSGVAVAEAISNQTFKTINGAVITSSGNIEVQIPLSTQTAYTSKGTTTKVPQITTNTLGQVTGITEVDIAFPNLVPITNAQIDDLFSNE